MSTAVLHDLQAIFDKLPTDKWVRAVVLTGAGHAFCGGHDLYQMHDSQGDKQYFERMFARCSRFMLSIQRVPQPVVAAVNGLATGAGASSFLFIFLVMFCSMCACVLVRLSHSMRVCVSFCSLIPHFF